MDEAEFRANPPRPGDKVWLRPQTVTSVDVRDSVVRIVGAYFNAADIDRIERAPRVPVVGDRVLWNSHRWTVRAIDDTMAWLAPEDVALARHSVALQGLQVIEP